MVKALFDSCILIDFLNGQEPARRELSLYAERHISRISWIEVMAGADAATEVQTRTFLAGFDLVELDAAVADRALALRRRHRLRLPDAIIWASADAISALLITRDEKAFPASDPGVRIPYRL